MGKHIKRVQKVFFWNYHAFGAGNPFKQATYYEDNVYVNVMVKFGR